MKIDWKKATVVGGLIIALIALIVAIFSMFRQAASNQQASSTTPFGVVAPAVNTGVRGVEVLPGSGNLPIGGAQGGATTQPIFKIADGPIAGAELVNYGIPTTTYSRYITSENGHVYEQALDAPGSFPRKLSNTTIPGVSRAIWTDGGNGVIMQYLQSGAIKTVHILFATTSTATSEVVIITPAIVHFLPDGITGVAASPSGKNIAYMLHSGSGSDVYIAPADGNAKKLFSLPLSELDISWPATTTVFLYTKSAGGIQGIGFSADTKTGSVVPILYGVGLTATANIFLSNILYRTDTGHGATLYSEKVSSGQSFMIRPVTSLASPLPETCVWNSVHPLQAFCIAPVLSAPDNYLELWHRGEFGVASALVSVDTANNSSSLVATPGSRDGGEPSDACSLAISPDAHYLSFISKSSQKLWGVRLAQ